MKNKLKTLLIWTAPLVVTLASANIAYAKDIQQKAKDLIDQTSETLQRGIEKLGDDFAKIQEYLDNYSWKGIIQDHASSKAETLSHLNLNNRGKVIVVRPGEKVNGSVICSLNTEKAHTLLVYRAVIGLYGEGPQSTIGRTLGINGGSSEEHFTLVAPTKPGIYQIRFRTADNYLESKALDAWWDEKGHEPDASTTIGIIYVQ